MRFKVISLLSVIFLLLVACQKPAEKGTEINYKNGFVDIDVAALGNPEEYQEQRLELPISVHNTLAYDIEDISLSVKGFDNHYVELYSEEQEVDLLEGRSVFNPEGGEEKILFEGTVKRLLPGADKEPQNYRVYVKYNSKVEFSPSICVTSNADGYVGAAYDTYQGACTFQKEISYKGQGAPVGITLLEVIARQGRQVELRMKVENKGTGSVGRITLGTATLGGKPLTCEFRGDTVDSGFLFEGEEKSAILLCAGYLSSDATYTTPLYVELFYDYEIDQKGMLTILE